MLHVKRKSVALIIMSCSLAAAIIILALGSIIS